MTEMVLQRIGYKWSEIFIYAAIGLGPLGLAVSSSAQVAPRFAIEAAQVTRAMAEASLPVDGVEIKIAAPVTSVTDKAPIQVKTVTLIGAHSVRMRLACRDHAQCLPFFAVANFPETVDASKLFGVKSSQLGAEPEPQVGAGQEAGPTVAAATPAARPTTMGEVAILHAGAPATLEMDEDRIHIRLEVICLQGGAAGSRVRAASLDHKQVYTAEVLTPTLLRGEFLK